MVISITRKINLFGFNTFDLCSYNISKHTFVLIQKNEKEFFIKECNEDNKEEILQKQKQLYNTHLSFL